MKIDIHISGDIASGKTTMAQFLYSILKNYEFDIEIVDDGVCRMDLSKINLERFKNFIPLKSDVCITVHENHCFNPQNQHLEINFDDLVSTESFKEVGIFKDVNTKKE